MRKIRIKLISAAISVVFISIYCFYCVGFRQVPITILDAAAAREFTINHRIRDGFAIGHGKNLFGSKTTEIIGSEASLTLGKNEFPFSIFHKSDTFYMMTQNTRSGRYGCYKSEKGGNWAAIDIHEILRGVDTIDILPNVHPTNSLDEFSVDIQRPFNQTTSIGDFYFWIKNGRHPPFTASVKESLTPREYELYNERIMKIVASCKN